MRLFDNKYLVLLICAFFPISHQSYAQDSWEIDKDKDGIKVYTKAEEGSDFKSFKAVVNLPATTGKILEILQNADGYSEWYGFTKTSILLKQEKNAQYNYVETDFPWPYRNRDMVYKMSIDTLNHEMIKISLTGIPDYIPVKKGKVRMDKAEGYILLQSSDDSTEVNYVFHSEPGNKIPSWLANNSISELPFRTLSGLRKMIQK